MNWLNSDNNNKNILVAATSFFIGAATATAITYTVLSSKYYTSKPKLIDEEFIAPPQELELVPEENFISNDEENKSEDDLIPETIVDAVQTDKFFIGVDLGGTNLKFGLFSFDGKLKSQYSTPIDKSFSGEEITTIMAKQINIMISAVREERILGIGIATLGLQDLPNETIIASSNLPNLTNFKLMESLKPKLNLKSASEGGSNIRIRFLHDATAALLGEVWTGSLDHVHLKPNNDSLGTTNASSYLIMTIGTGIGCAALSHSILFSCELGHTLIEVLKRPNSKKCKVKTLDDICSAAALEAAQKLDAKETFRLAANGDKAALRNVKDMCEYIAIAAINLTRMFDPETIVFAGGVTQEASGELFISLVREYYDIHNWKLTPSRCTLKLATHYANAGIFGAAYSTHPNCKH